MWSLTSRKFLATFSANLHYPVRWDQNCFLKCIFNLSLFFFNLLFNLSSLIFLVFLAVFWSVLCAVSTTLDANRAEEQPCLENTFWLEKIWAEIRRLHPVISIYSHSFNFKNAQCFLLVCRIIFDHLQLNPKSFVPASYPFEKDLCDQNNQHCLLFVFQAANEIDTLIRE